MLIYLNCAYHTLVVLSIDNNLMKSGLLVHNELCRIISGFPDKDGCHKEFLFSLPRFADDYVSID